MIRVGDAKVILAQRLRSPWSPHIPTTKQRELLECSALEVLYGGASGGGKSDALLADALRYAGVRGYSAIMFRRSYTDLALPGALMDRAHQWLCTTAARWRDRDKTWEFPGGATLTFGYLDGRMDHYRYQSAEFQRIYFDELTQFEERQYLYLFSRLRRRADATVPLAMRSASNPGGIGHDWVKQRFLIDPRDRIFIRSTLRDNPHLDQARYLESLGQLDPITRRQLIDGEWVRDSAELVYTLPDSSIVDRVPGEIVRHVVGIDYGVTDATAFSVIGETADGLCVVLESHKRRGLSPSDAAAVVRDLEDRYRPDRIVGDVGGLGKGFVTEARQRFAQPIEAAQKHNKLGYVRLLNGDLASANTVVFRRDCSELIEEYRSLVWSDGRHQKEHPGLDNHCADATLYAWREARHWDRPAEPTQQREPPWSEEEDKYFRSRVLALESEEDPFA